MFFEEHLEKKKEDWAKRWLSFESTMLDAAFLDMAALANAIAKYKIHAKHTSDAYQGFFIVKNFSAYRLC